MSESPDSQRMHQQAAATAWRARLRVWIVIVLLFAAASGLQILMYGGRRVWGGDPGSVIRFPAFLSLAFLVTFYFGPGLAAAALALQLLYRAYRREALGPPALAVFIVVVLAVMSCYAGMVTSLTTWGT